jgi:hypothetical protein
VNRYYKMKDCFDDCEDNDFPYNEETGSNIVPWQCTKKEIIEKNKLFSYQSINSDQWQIKRANSDNATAGIAEKMIEELEAAMRDYIALSDKGLWGK